VWLTDRVSVLAALIPLENFGTRDLSTTKGQLHEMNARQSGARSLALLIGTYLGNSISSGLVLKRIRLVDKRVNGVQELPSTPILHFNSS